MCLFFAAHAGRPAAPRRLEVERGNLPPDGSKEERTPRGRLDYLSLPAGQEIQTVVMSQMNPIVASATLCH